jgi:hypothetical protein
MSDQGTTKDLSIRPVTLRQARAFVQEHHRHHDMPQGGLWAIALMRSGELVGVAIAGRPVSRILQRKGYCEVVRVCVLPGVRNGCSMLYARCRRIAQQMGYTRTISYTLPSEGGASLRAAGFEAEAETGGGSWSRRSRPRIDTHPTEPKIRWGSAA